MTLPGSFLMIPSSPSASFSNCPHLYSKIYDFSANTVVFETRPRCIKVLAHCRVFLSPSFRAKPCRAFVSSMDRGGNLPLFKSIQSKLQVILGIKNVKDSVPANYANTLEELAELLVRSSASMVFLAHLFSSLG